MKQLKAIFYHFCPSTNMPNIKKKCMLNAHLNNGTISSLVLSDIELDPNYMTEDRLYGRLMIHCMANAITDYKGVLESFVIDFIKVLRLREKEIKYV